MICAAGAVGGEARSPDGIGAVQPHRGYLFWSRMKLLSSSYPAPCALQIPYFPPLQSPADFPPQHVVGLLRAAALGPDAEQVGRGGAGGRRWHGAR